MRRCGLRVAQTYTAEAWGNGPEDAFAAQTARIAREGEWVPNRGRGASLPAMERQPGEDRDDARDHPGIADVRASVFSRRNGTSPLHGKADDDASLDAGTTSQRIPVTLPEARVGYIYRCADEVPAYRQNAGERHGFARHAHRRHAEHEQRERKSAEAHIEADTLHDAKVSARDHGTKRKTRETYGATAPELPERLESVGRVPQDFALKVRRKGDREPTVSKGSSVPPPCPDGGESGGRLRTPEENGP